MQPRAARAAEWSWVLLAFVIASLTFAATQPVHPREGLGEAGQVFHAMAKAMPRELPPTGIAPYVYRFGLPLAAATVAKSLDWVIAAGFDRLDLLFNALSMIFLTILLQRHVSSMFARIVVVIAFIVEPHSPIRLSYMHPLSTDSGLIAGLLAGLIAIEWFHSRSSPARAAVLSVLIVAGVAFHELMLIIGVCALFVPRSSESRFATLERSGGWLPLISGAIALIAVHAWIEPTPADSSVLKELMRGFSEKSVLQLGLGLFLVFGPLLVLAASFWKGTVGFLRQHPVFVAYLILCFAWAWSSGDHIERGFALASPIVYMLIARALSIAPMDPAGAGMAGLLMMQGLSSRVFSPIGGPIDTPAVVSEVWERLGWADVAWALSYPNMWSQLCAGSMIPIYLAWYGLTGFCVWMLVRGGNRHGESTERRSAHASEWPPRIAAFFYGPGKPIAVGLLTCLALAPIVWLALSRFYWHHYAQPGPGYFVYNLARVWLVAVLIAVFRATGFRIASAHATSEHRDRPIEFAIGGAAAWSIVVVVLAALHLYHLWVVLPMLAIAVALAINDMLHPARASSPSDQRPVTSWGFAGILMRFGVGIHALVILVGIALWGHFGGDNDVPGNYLPYYETVLRDHTIAAGSYWVHFFASKGNGLAFLANVLSDVQGSSLATYAMLLIGAGLIWRVAARSVAKASAIGLVGACLFLQYYAGQGAYAKSHIIRNLFVLYIILSGVRLMFHEQGIDAVTRVCRAVVIVATIILSPLALVLLLPILVIEWPFLALSRRADPGRSLSEAVYALGTTAVVCAYNFFQTGLPELHDMPSFMSRFVSIDRFSRWIDPSLAYLDYRLAFLIARLPGEHPAATSAMSFAPSQSFTQVATALLTPATLALIGGAIVVGASGLVLSRRRSAVINLRHGVVPAVTYMLVVLSLLSVLQMFGGGRGSSMGRFTDFANPLGLAIGVLILTAAWSIEMARWPRRVLGTAIAAIALVAIYLGSPPVTALSWRTNVGFVTGQSSYASINEFHWNTLTGARVAAAMPPGARIELLNFLPGFTAMPATPFQRPDGSVYLKDYTRVLYGAADDVAAIYKGYKIDYFLFDVSKDSSIVWSGFSELFTPASIRSRMRLVSHHQSSASDLYLLTWQGQDDASLDDFETFLLRWDERLSAEKANGRFYSGFQYGAEQVGRHE